MPQRRHTTAPVSDIKVGTPNNAPGIQPVLEVNIHVVRDAPLS